MKLFSSTKPKPTISREQQALCRIKAVRRLVAIFLVPAFAFSVVSTASALSQRLSTAQASEGRADLESTGVLLANQLRNPLSTRFRNVHIIKTSGEDHQEHIFICGELNSQVGTGAMSGFHAFLFRREFDRVYVADDDGSDDLIVKAVCSSDLNPPSHDYSAVLKAFVIKSSGT